jgi:NhaA family Na+:H+ antiporter
MTGVAMLGGIGFTMSLLINELAFPDPGDARLRASAQIGILGASLIAGGFGLLMLHASARRMSHSRPRV